MPDDLNYSALRFFWDVIQSLLLAVLFVWRLIDKKRQQNSDGIDTLTKRLGSISQRVQKLEDTQAALPTHQDLSAVKNEVSGLREKIEAQNNLLQTIHQFLLNDRRGEK